MPPVVWEAISCCFFNTTIWLAMAGHGRTWPATAAAMARYGQPCIAGHGHAYPIAKLWHRLALRAFFASGPIGLWTLGTSWGTAHTPDRQIDVFALLAVSQEQMNPRLGGTQAGPIAQLGRGLRGTRRKEKPSLKKEAYEKLPGSSNPLNE